MFYHQPILRIFQSPHVLCLINDHQQGFQRRCGGVLGPGNGNAVHVLRRLAGMARMYILPPATFHSMCRILVTPVAPRLTYARKCSRTRVRGIRHWPDNVWCSYT